MDDGIVPALKRPAKFISTLRVESESCGKALPIACRRRKNAKTSTHSAPAFLSAARFIQADD